MYIVHAVLIQIAVVSDSRSMNKLPEIEGLLSYRADDSKLYLKEKAEWRALATQKDVSFTPPKIKDTSNFITFMSRATERNITGLRLVV